MSTQQAELQSPAHVPQAIQAEMARAREARAAYLEGRKEIVNRASRAIQAQDAARKKWTSSEIYRQIKEPARQDLSGFDRAIWTYLEEAAGSTGTVFRPDWALVPQAAPNDPPKIQLSPNGSMYQHGFIEAIGDDDYLATALGVGFGLLAPVGAGLLGLGLHTTNRAYEFGFAEYVVPSDGLYVVTAAVSVAGTYHVYSDADWIHFNQAGVQIHAGLHSKEGGSNGYYPVYGDYYPAYLLYRTGAEIDELKDFIKFSTTTAVLRLYGGQKLNFTVRFDVTCTAKGAASMGVINMHAGAGGMACNGCLIEKVANLS